MKRLVTICSAAAIALSAAGAASAADVTGSHAWGSSWSSIGHSAPKLERGSKPKLERGSKPKLERGNVRLHTNAAAWD